MSARLSAALPRACSGDIYAAVPRIIPACVIAGDVMVGDALREVLALDQFHHESMHARQLLETVDGGDVRVVQGREGPRFALETRQAFGVGGKRIGEDLDRDLAAERGVGAAPHLPHAAFTDLSGDVVDAKTSSSRRSRRKASRMVRSPSSRAIASMASFRRSRSSSRRSSSRCTPRWSSRRFARLGRRNCR